MRTNSETKQEGQGALPVQHTEPLRGKGHTSMMEVRQLGNNGGYAIMHTSNSAIICYSEDGTKENAEKILTLLTSAPELLKENQELKEKVKELQECFNAESDHVLDAQKSRNHYKALNAELLEALKNVIGDISAPYGFDATRIPNESVKKALKSITKAEGKGATNV